MNEWFQDKEKIRVFQDWLLSWYDTSKRNLPWRETSNPYKIWISEIMSQQTQVETVIPYYTRFIDKYPDIESLAKAEDEVLLKLWEGLGYYSRARNLKVAAQEIVSRFSGVFPDKLEDILSLKGIGPYTAASIGSIAFDLPEPALDGNLFRVGSRLFALEVDIAKSRSRKIFQKKWQEVMNWDRPGDFNQALMDLGARICRPKSPDCQTCPIKDFCQAYQEGSQENFPVKSSQIKQKQVYYQAFVLQNHRGEFLLEQRPTRGLLANMWTFPMVEVVKNQDVQVPKSLRESVIRYTSLGEVNQVFTHLKWHIQVIFCQIREDQIREVALYNQKWEKPNHKKTVFPKAQLKMFKLVEEGIDVKN